MHAYRYTLNPSYHAPTFGPDFPPDRRIIPTRAEVTTVEELTDLYRHNVDTFATAETFTFTSTTTTDLATHAMLTPAHLFTDHRCPIRPRKRPTSKVHCATASIGATYRWLRGDSGGDLHLAFGATFSAPRGAADACESYATVLYATTHGPNAHSPALQAWQRTGVIV